MLTDRNEGVGLAEIHRSIDSDYTKQGINQILHQLAEDGIIKNITVKPKDPRYILVETISAKRRIELKNYVKKLEELIQVLP